MQHSSPRKVYYQKNRALFLVMAAGLAVLGGWLTISLQSIMIALLYLLGIAFICVLQTVRIVTSLNGISYYNMGVYAIHSPWENIDRIDLVDFRLLGKQRCIILKNGAKLGPWTDIAWGLAREQRGRTIPIPRFYGWGKTGELLQDIKRYVPQVTGLE
jgi:hypothetical protein